MRPISSTSRFIASASGDSPISASSSLNRVSTVRKSCETPASMAARDHLHDRAVELDAHLDQRRAADGVDPIRAADALADFFRQRLVEQREEWLWADRR